MSYDRLSFGETMIALAPRPGASIRDADSLLVDHAGDDGNTTVGLSRLGLHVAWVSWLGDDAAGSRIPDALAVEGVDTRWVRRDPRRPTGLLLKESVTPRGFLAARMRHAKDTKDTQEELTRDQENRRLLAGTTRNSSCFLRRT